MKDSYTLDQTLLMSGLFLSSYYLWGDNIITPTLS